MTDEELTDWWMFHGPRHVWMTEGFWVIFDPPDWVKRVLRWLLWWRP